MFNPKDFLRVAEELSLSAQDEAKIRTSICRSYFSAYLIAREWLKTKGCTFFDRGIDHSIARDGLLKYVDKTTSDMLRMLGIDNRGDADYILTKTLQQRDALDAIELAKVIIAKISPPPGTPAVPPTASNPSATT